MEAVEKKWHSFGSLGTILFCIDYNIIFFSYTAVVLGLFLSFWFLSHSHILCYFFNASVVFFLPVKEKMTVTMYI